ncbi:hypothetical protein F511_31407 [Dorcoceras hygrometricum]|uniref:Uncharacterized protein n=1 Tax=Dorcoceras hygrometricum TaxID=472368 RepID=A0A2Z7DJP1_9LAMI|nr:hypothetical protein F511_31407 [Dorcoceras hygrometricum]
MASLFISNALQINFDYVLGIQDNEGMVTMFKALEASGLRGFLGCPSVLYEQELAQFFDTAIVQDGDITCAVSGKQRLCLPRMISLLVTMADPYPVSRGHSGSPRPETRVLRQSALEELTETESPLRDGRSKSGERGDGAWPTVAFESLPCWRLGAWLRPVSQENRHFKDLTRTESPLRDGRSKSGERGDGAWPTVAFESLPCWRLGAWLRPVSQENRHFKDLTRTESPLRDGRSKSGERGDGAWPTVAFESLPCWRLGAWLRPVSQENRHFKDLTRTESPLRDGRSKSGERGDGAWPTVAFESLPCWRLGAWLRPVSQENRHFKDLTRTESPLRDGRSKSGERGDGAWPTVAFESLPCWRLGAWLRPVSQENRHFKVKAGSFDDVTHERFLMMTAIHFGVKLNWSQILFAVLKEMADRTIKRAKVTIVKRKSVSKKKSAPTDKKGADEEPVEVVEKTVSKKRSASTGDEPTVTKKNRTIKKKAALSKASMALVSVAQDVEPLFVVPAVEEIIEKAQEASTADDVDQLVARIISETTEMEPKEMFVETDAGISNVIMGIAYFVETEVAEGIATGTDLADQLEPRSDDVMVEVAERLTAVVDEGIAMGTILTDMEEDYLKNKDIDLSLVESTTAKEVDSTPVTDVGHLLLEEESLSIDDLLKWIPGDMMLPSVFAAEPTKIKFSNGISIPGVADGDLYKASLPKIMRLALTSFTRKPALQTVGSGRSSIRSMTGIKTPSSACTRRPDEFSTDGNTSARWPEQFWRRGGDGDGDGGGGGVRLGGEEGRPRARG